MRDLTNGKTLSSILFFSVPIFIGDFLQQMYVIVDSIIVGKLIGTEALAAVGVTQPVYSLITCIFLGISIGFSILLAHLKGANASAEEYTKAIGSLVLVTVIASILIVVAGVFSVPSILRLTGTPDAILADSTIYLKYLLIGIIANFVLMSTGAVLRAFGDTKTPLIMYVSGSFLNILFDLLFVGLFNMGLRGAALGTILAQLISSIVTVLFTLHVYHVKLFIVLKRLSFSFTYFKQAVLYGMPIAVQYICIAIGTMILVRIVIPMGLGVIGAFTVIGRVETFIAMPFLNISSGLTTFTAQNYGAKFMDRIYEGFKKTMLFILIFTIIMSIVFLLSAGALASLFTNDSEVIAITKEYLYITSPFLFLYTLMVTIHGMLNGLGKTQGPLFCTIFSYLIVRIPLSYIVCNIFHVTGVIWAVVIGWAAGLVFSVFYVLLSLRRYFPVNRGK
jgi:putative MATE family efflux protein